MRQIGHFIGGRHLAGRGERSGPVMNPATGQQIGAGALASAAEVAEAVAVAEAAQVAWARVPPLQRARVMLRFKRNGSPAHTLLFCDTRDHLFL